MDYVAYFLIVNLLLIWKIFWDCRAMHIEKRIVNKTKSALIDGSVYIMSLVSLGFGWVWGAGLFLASLTYRWVFFDIGFNLANNRNWRYYGENAWTDRFLKKVGYWDIPIKLIPAIIGIVLIIIFNHG